MQATKKYTLYTLNCMAALYLCCCSPDPIELGVNAPKNEEEYFMLPFQVDSKFSPQIWKQQNSLNQPLKFDPEGCGDKHSESSKNNQCYKFKFKPRSSGDTAGSVWIHNNNQGEYVGLKIEKGARFVKFEAKSNLDFLRVLFGVGIRNIDKSPDLYQPNPDVFGMAPKELEDKVIFESKVFYMGRDHEEEKFLGVEWKPYQIELNELFLEDEDYLPQFNLVGAFKFLIERDNSEEVELYIDNIVYHP